MMKKVVVLACMLSLLVPAAVLVGCGSGTSAQTPGQVAQAFLVAAVKKKDAKSSWNMSSADSQKALKTESSWETYLKQVPSSNVNFTVGKATINGNKATVKVTEWHGCRNYQTNC